MPAMPIRPYDVLPRKLTAQCPVGRAAHFVEGGNG